MSRQYLTNTKKLAKLKTRLKLGASNSAKTENQSSSTASLSDENSFTAIVLVDKNTTNWLYSRFTALVLLLCLFVSSPSHALLDVDRDGFKGKASSTVYSMYLQSDGKILLGGDVGVLHLVGPYGSYDPRSFSRINSDGRLDTLFDPALVEGTVYSMVQRPNGKVLIAGDLRPVTYPDGRKGRDIVQINANGSIDPNFVANTEDSLYRQINAIALQPDGKTIIGGAFSRVNGVMQSYIARLNTDGSLDAGFSPVVNAPVLALTLQGDGKILVGGTFTSIDGKTRNRYARLNSDGSLDAGFSSSPGTGTVNSEVYALAQQADGKILAAGWFTTINGVVRQNIARLNPNGSLDPSLSLNVNGKIRAITLQPDGKILIAGAFTRVNGALHNRLARINQDGSHDSSFKTGSYGTTDGDVYTLASQTDGKVVIGGSYLHYNGSAQYYIARFERDGSLDSGYGRRGQGPNNTVFAIAMQADGKALIGGDFSNVQGWDPTYNRVARLNVNGQIDSSFRIGTGANDKIYALTQLPDKKILIAGAFTSFNNWTRNRIARLNKDGSIDRTFFPDINGTVYAMQQQTDGKVLIGGWFTQVNGTPRNHIARINHDGSLDLSFNPGSGANSLVVTLAQQQDGKVLIGGRFTEVGGMEHWAIARLNANGSLDTSFNLGRITVEGGGTGFVHTLSVQADGKILIGGRFDFIMDSIRAPLKNIARLTPDGNLDWGFIPPSNIDGRVYALALQANGDVIIAGNFLMGGSEARKRFARLHSNGSLDTYYKLQPDQGPDDAVYALAIQTDGKVLFGGAFTRIFADTVLYRTNNLFRMRNYHYSYTSIGVKTALQNLGATTSGKSLNWSMQGAWPAQERVMFDMSNEPDSDWSALGTGSHTSTGWKLDGISLPYNQVLYIRARGYYGGGSRSETIRQVFLTSLGISSPGETCFPIIHRSGGVAVICL